jgi:hypothetical protein
MTAISPALQFSAFGTGAGAPARTPLRPAPSSSHSQLRARVLREIEAAEARLVQTLAQMREGLA